MCESERALLCAYIHRILYCIVLYCIVVKGLPSTEVLEKSRGLLRHEFSIPPSNPNGSTPHLLYALCLLLFDIVMPSYCWNIIYRIRTGITYIIYWVINHKIQLMCKLCFVSSFYCNCVTYLLYLLILMI